MSFIKTVQATNRNQNFKFNIEKYDSAMEVVEKCKTRPMTSNSFQDMANKSYGRWEGVSSYDEALSFLKHGYQPTVNDLKGAFKNTIKGDSSRFKFENAVAGFAPVVPLALKGVPQSMINMTMKPIKAKVVDIYYDMTCSCSTTSQQIINAGKTLLGAIIELEKQGYRFNLYAVQTYTDEYRRAISSDMLVIKIKNSSQPLDLKRVSFPLTHSAFFRIIGFDWYSKVPGGRYRSSYGCALAYKVDQRGLDEISKLVFGKNAIYIACSNIVSKDKEYLKEVLENGNSSN